MKTAEDAGDAELNGNATVIRHPAKYGPPLALGFFLHFLRVPGVLGGFHLLCGLRELRYR
jgi:hypothetical protein